MPYQPGETLLGKYQIEALLGQGAFGEVYRVQHLRLRVPRALKILRRDSPGIGNIDFKNVQARFELEAELGARLNSPTPHPNLLQVHDFSIADGILALEMEYAPGGSLGQKLRKLKAAGTTIPTADIIRIAADVAKGLAVLHADNIVHRDIKPGNILFDELGRAKVADLGLAQVSGGDSDRTKLGSLAAAHPGTPQYMSPEQGKSLDFLTPASDIYSLGLVLFECFTGMFFQFDKKNEIRLSRPETPEWLNKLVLCMLERESEKRYSSAAVLGESIKQQKPVAKSKAPPEGISGLAPFKLNDQNSANWLSDFPEVCDNAWEMALTEFEGGFIQEHLVRWVVALDAKGQRPLSRECQKIIEISKQLRERVKSHEISRELALEEFLQKLGASPPNMYIEPAEVDFGVVDYRKTGYTTLTLNNIGPRGFFHGRLSIDSTWLEIANLDFDIPPHQRTEIFLKARTDTLRAGKQQACIKVYGNLSDVPSFSVNVQLMVSINALITKVREQLGAGKPEDAEILCLQALEAQPDHPETIKLLIQSYLAQAKNRISDCDWPGAQKFAMNVLKIDLNNTGAKEIIANAQRGQVTSQISALWSRAEADIANHMWERANGQAAEIHKLGDAGMSAAQHLRDKISRAHSTHLTVEIGWLQGQKKWNDAKKILNQLEALGGEHRLSAKTLREKVFRGQIADIQTQSRSAFAQENWPKIEQFIRQLRTLGGLGEKVATDLEARMTVALTSIQLAERGWLNPANPGHWMVLFGWIMFQPEKLEHYQLRLKPDGRARLARIGHRLSGSFLWAMLLFAQIEIHASYLSNFQSSVVPSTQEYWPFTLVLIAIGWGITSFGDRIELPGSGWKKLIPGLFLFILPLLLGFSVASDLGNKEYILVPFTLTCAMAFALSRFQSNWSGAEFLFDMTNDIAAIVPGGLMVGILAGAFVGMTNDLGLLPGLIMSAIIVLFSGGLILSIRNKQRSLRWRWFTAAVFGLGLLLNGVSMLWALIF